MAKAKPVASIQVEGLREFHAAVRRSADKDLPKRLGAANKAIGEHVIRNLEPASQPSAVGAGAGAKVRPSASKRDVLLRVGGKHRAGSSPQAQWGKRFVGRVGTPRPKRPYIKETALSERDEIERMYLDGIATALRGAFYKTTGG